MAAHTRFGPAWTRGVSLTRRRGEIVYAGQLVAGRIRTCSYSSARAMFTVLLAIAIKIVCPMKTPLPAIVQSCGHVVCSYGRSAACGQPTTKSEKLDENSLHDCQGLQIQLNICAVFEWSILLCAKGCTMSNNLIKYRQLLLSEQLLNCAFEPCSQAMYKHTTDRAETTIHLEP